MRSLPRAARALLAALPLLSATACTDPPAVATDACPVVMTTTAQVRAGDTPVSVGFTGTPPPATTIDRDRPVAVAVVGAAAGRARASFVAAAAQPHANAVAGTLTASLDDGVPLAEITFTVPLLVARVRSCGTASTRVLPVTTPPTPPGGCDPAATAARLQQIVDGATLTLRTPDARLFTRVPLTPFVPELQLPEVGRLSSEVLPVPLAGAVPQVRFQVAWGVEGASGYATTPDGRSPVALGAPSADTSVVLRVLPPVVPVPEGGAPLSGAVVPRVTARVSASVVGCGDVRVSARTPAAADAPAVALPLPRVLALYRAPDMVSGYPAWRTAPPTRNSGVVVFGSPAALEAPSVPLATLVAGAAGLPTPVPGLEGLGQRLGEIEGPVPTTYGPAGLATLPADALPAGIVRPAEALRRLSQAIRTLTTTYAPLAARTGGRYARLHPAASVDDLGAVNIIDGEGVGSLQVHVQDEAEAAILLGPAGTAADLFTLAGFNPRIQGPFHVDSGMARVATARDGYVAVLPDLAVAGAACGSRSNGWLPATSGDYAAAHAVPDHDGYGTLRMYVTLDGDRGSSDAPDVRRSSVPADWDDSRYDDLNRRRAQSMSRTMSSLRIGDASMALPPMAC